MWKQKGPVPAVIDHPDNTFVWSLNEDKTREYVVYADESGRSARFPPPVLGLLMMASHLLALYANTLV